MDSYWEVLLAHLISFRWIYPGQRDAVPEWLMQELTSRLRTEIGKPVPASNLCRGRMLSKADYEIDVKSWGLDDTLPSGDPAG
jgi:hypothetical protein